MQKLRRILTVISLILCFLGCSRDISTSGEPELGASTLSGYFDDCITQPIIPEDLLTLRSEDLDPDVELEERIVNFEDSTEISIELTESYIAPIGVNDNERAIKIQFNAFLWNHSSEQMVMRVPAGASNSIGTMGLFIEIMDSEENQIIDLDHNSFDAIYPTRESFVIIPPGEYHCEKYQLSWLVSEDGLVMDQDGSMIEVGNFILPGSYQLRVNYHNYSIGFGEYDANPFIGNMYSNWVEIEIPSK